MPLEIHTTDLDSEFHLHKLREQDIKKIVSAFKKHEEIDRYCHIAEFDELKENDYDLNVPRYVDISEDEEEIDIQATIEGLKKLDKERHEIEIQVNSDLKKLGFKL